jgi:radical SAM superfamily enzyme YgiQ (UPF0313 family)
MSNSPRLPDHIEHHMPDYDLYCMSKRWESLNDYFKNYSIGFTTRGCFRKCSFCVNAHYDKAVIHSPLSEFVDVKRSKICLLDDNILAYSDNSSILNELQSTGKRFVFKQGIDIRLLTDSKAKCLVESKYDGDYLFAFDNK